MRRPASLGREALEWSAGPGRTRGDRHNDNGEAFRGKRHTGIHGNVEAASGLLQSALLRPAAVTLRGTRCGPKPRKGVARELLGATKVRSRWTDTQRGNDSRLTWTWPWLKKAERRGREE
ncbi:hypothetical protein ERJ75_000687400 [Trypanosoma vivax]|nr:hypothetical protein ERJ75_000687400 [Trypanosoma vivax]